MSYIGCTEETCRYREKLRLLRQGNKDLALKDQDLARDSELPSIPLESDLFLDKQPLALWDLPDQKSLQKTQTTVYNNQSWYSFFQSTFSHFEFLKAYLSLGHAFSQDIQGLIIGFLF